MDGRCGRSDYQGPHSLNENTNVQHVLMSTIHYHVPIQAPSPALSKNDAADDAAAADDDDGDDCDFFFAWAKPNESSMRQKHKSVQKKGLTLA